MVKAVIFDVDGTLIDSVDLHGKAWQEAFARHGVTTDFKAVRAQIGKGGDKLMKVFLSEDQIKREGTEIEEERSDLFKREYLPLVKPFPGLRGLFERLRDDGIKMALASSAKGDELEAYKKVSGIAPFLSKETSSDDVSSSKPDPDIFQAVQRKLGIDPSDIIAVGDTKYDAESAGKAGMATIGVLCGGSDAAKLRAAGCIAVYQDPADLLMHYDSSPLVSKGGTKAPSHILPSFLMGFTIGVAVRILCAKRHPD